MKCFFIGWICMALFSKESHAAVRTVEATDQAITPIYLSLGRSTVLRFAEKPKRVVVGNQNYFNIEFIENDLAIQPTGTTSTNLFVYGERHNYGFNLRVGGPNFDDLVHVGWRVPSVKNQASRPKPPATKSKDIGKQVKLNHFQLRLERSVLLQDQNVLWVEILLLSQNAKPIAVKDIELDVTEGKARLKMRFICEKSKVGPYQKSQCRLFLPMSNVKNKLLKVKYQGSVAQATFAIP